VAHLIHYRTDTTSIHARDDSEERIQTNLSTNSLIAANRRFEGMSNRFGESLKSPNLRIMIFLWIRLSQQRARVSGVLHKT
jgi:hypothetical protein